MIKAEEEAAGTNVDSPRQTQPHDPFYDLFCSLSPDKGKFTHILPLSYFHIRLGGGAILQSMWGGGGGGRLEGIGGGLEEVRWG